MASRLETDGRQQVHASAQLFENVNISGGHHIVSINNGSACGVICDTEGEILVFDSDRQKNVTLKLRKGDNRICVTKVYDTSTIVGTVTLVAW